MNEENWRDLIARISSPSLQQNACASPLPPSPNITPPVTPGIESDDESRQVMGVGEDKTPVIKFVEAGLQQRFHTSKAKEASTEKKKWSVIAAKSLQERGVTKLNFPSKTDGKEYCVTAKPPAKKPYTREDLLSSIKLVLITEHRWNKIDAEMIIQRAKEIASRSARVAGSQDLVARISCKRKASDTHESATFGKRFPTQPWIWNVFLNNWVKNPDWGNMGKDSWPPMPKEPEFTETETNRFIFTSTPQLTTSPISNSELGVAAVTHIHDAVKHK
jgi:hypothetical protein